MKEYSVYSDSKRRLRAVKNGWCWPAFFFGSFWSLFSGFFLAAIVMLPAELILSFASNVVSETQRLNGPEDATRLMSGAIALIFIIIRITYGARGNQWRKARYLRKGFEFRSTVKAPSIGEALKTFAGLPG